MVGIKLVLCFYAINNKYSSFSMGLTVFLIRFFKFYSYQVYSKQIVPVIYSNFILLLCKLQKNLELVISTFVKMNTTKNSIQKLSNFKWGINKTTNLKEKR